MKYSHLVRELEPFRSNVRVRGSRGFTCHPRMGLAIGVMLYAAIALPFVGEYANLAGSSAPWFVWGLFALGCLLYAACGLAIWEANLLAVLLGWALGYGVMWVMKESGSQRMTQILVLLVVSQVPAALALIWATLKRD
jgi:hypothetical protein